MPEYSDPEKNYTVSYPEGWLPLTHEGSPHVSLASLTTGGYLKIEAYHFEQPASSDDMRPERTLQALIECERRTWPEIDAPRIQGGHRNGMASAYMTCTRVEVDEEHAADFGHTRAWVFTRANVQVRCLYRCHS